MTNELMYRKIKCEIEGLSFLVNGLEKITENPDNKLILYKTYTRLIEISSMLEELE